MKKDYIQFISDIKENILRSRYKAASLANREMLLLYYYTGYKLSEKINQAKWGAGIIRNISDDLQKELPGLRGFSYSNLKNMRQFYEEYHYFANYMVSAINEGVEIGQLPTAQFSQSVTGQFEKNELMQLITAQFENGLYSSYYTDKQM